MTSADAPSASDATEADDRRRGNPRQRVLLAGKLLLPNGFTLDCSIRNLSKGGAQIRVDSTHGLPDTFLLIEIRSGTAYRAHIAWRTPTLAGLRLFDAIDLKQPGVPVQLRQLWMACIPR
jgi:hypothetical protein